MTEEKALIPFERRESLALESIADLEARFALAVRQRELLSDYIRKQLKPKKHFYKVGGSDKPSLTKDGAEVVCLPHGLLPDYEILSGPKEPSSANEPYQIVVKCSFLRGGQFAGSGIGSASSWITPRNGPRRTRQNDPGLCHNATLKMAQKSAYIAATLNATAASEFFTQDMEDESVIGVPRPAVPAASDYSTTPVQGTSPNWGAFWAGKDRKALHDFFQIDDHRGAMIAKAQALSILWKLTLAEAVDRMGREFDDHYDGAPPRQGALVGEPEGDLE